MDWPDRQEQASEPIFKAAKAENLAPAAERTRFFARGETLSKSSGSTLTLARAKQRAANPP
jgi:hypothetical protein